MLSITVPLLLLPEKLRVWGALQNVLKWNAYHEHHLLDYNCRFYWMLFSILHIINITCRIFPSTFATSSGSGVKFIVNRGSLKAINAETLSQPYVRFHTEVSEIATQA